MCSLPRASRRRPSTVMITLTRYLYYPLAVALAEHPGSLDEIDRLVTRLSATDEGRKVLPEGGEELWAAVTAARVEVGDGR